MCSNRGHRSGEQEPTTLIVVVNVYFDRIPHTGSALPFGNKDWWRTQEKRLGVCLRDQSLRCKAVEVFPTPFGPVDQNSGGCGKSASSSSSITRRTYSPESKD
jgi:hypothetical protein